MKTIKRKLRLPVAAVIALVSGVGLLAETGTIDCATTNNIAASTTITTGVGNAVIVKNSEHVGALLTFTGLDVSTGNVVVTFIRGDGTYYETTPGITLTAAANGTNTVRAALTFTTVSPWDRLKILSIQNAATNGITNLTVRITQKQLR